MKTLLSMIHVDRALAARLEGAEGAANAAMVRTRAALQPGCGADVLEVAGARAMFDGADSPLTQTFGLGIERLPGDDEFAAIEAFFRDRGAAVCHEVCPLADPALPPMLAARGYRPMEQSNVMFQPIGLRPQLTLSRDVIARCISSDEGDLWSAVSAAGWTAESPELREFMEDLGGVMSRCACAVCFLAELDGWPIAAAALLLHDAVALLAGSSTVPRHRRRGAQAALLSTRLAYAASHGCDLGMVVVLPGSGSQRNAERSGFQVAYTRTKWQLAPSA